MTATAILCAGLIVGAPIGYAFGRISAQQDAVETLERRVRHYVMKEQRRALRDGRR